ncbi:lysosome-associated membrane glycoprotein 5-like isoform X2 [Stegodyphus dumicola]|uniref:lysosome-associated membrane glycoprotein 5-like isoform X2 n=1 Tax=Stegodyphus dumicola TaxID=202533 RepID=UPI0015B12B56|nr:lysosome-associated membrane glycoprotein 5-like isoform X2 [Stegodyphus dumicola]
MFVDLRKIIYLSYLILFLCLILHTTIGDKVHTEPKEENEDSEKGVSGLPAVSESNENQGTEPPDKIQEDVPVKPEENAEKTENIPEVPEEGSDENKDESAMENEGHLKEKEQEESESTVSEETVVPESSTEQQETFSPTEKIMEETTTKESEFIELEKVKFPKDTYAVLNNKNRICLLAKFDARISITYVTELGEEQVEVTVPKDGYVRGKCESSSKSPAVYVSWRTFVFGLVFDKTNGSIWIVNSVELTYNTSEPIFDGATKARKYTAKSKSISLFETPLGKSYYCPAEEVILLYHENKHVATARMSEIHLQPYDVKKGKFSQIHRCSKVVLDGPDETEFIQDETIPFAVGCTLALITLLILVGFSVHRAYHAAKVDYNTME